MKIKDNDKQKNQKTIQPKINKELNKTKTGWS